MTAIEWTRITPTLGASAFAPKVSHYRAEVGAHRFLVRPRWYIGKGPWGHGRKRTKKVVYDLMIDGRTVSSNWRAAKSAKGVAEGWAELLSLGDGFDGKQARAKYLREHA